MFVESAAETAQAPGAPPPSPTSVVLHDHEQIPADREHDEHDDATNNGTGKNGHRSVVEIGTADHQVVGTFGQLESRAPAIATVGFVRRLGVTAHALHGQGHGISMMYSSMTGDRKLD